MNTINQLTQQLKTMQGRVSELYRSVGTTSSPATDLLPIALKELGVAMEHLTRQNEHLVLTQTQLETKCQHYQTLIELTYDGHLITDTTGTIKEANRATARLLGIEPQFLVDKPLISLVLLKERSFFQAKLLQLEQRNQIVFSVRLQRYTGDQFDALLTGTAIRGTGNSLLSWHWLMRDVTKCKQAEKALKQVGYNLYQVRPLHFYSKGETIALDPRSIWLVSEGVVKLTTLSEQGEDILLSLAGNGMVFGSCLTAQPIYQATALLDAKLAQIPLIDIGQSSQLAQALLPLINQRLRQAESFVAIRGQLRVGDRLNRLLQLLKQEFGEPVENGMRIPVRLTHQDFASACGTTRVTITRLIGRLQQQGKIAIDAQNHLIVLDGTDLFARTM